MSECGKQLIQHLKNKGVTKHQSAENIAMQLWNLVVAEWLTNSAHYFHPIDNTCDFTVEATRFLASGHFAASLGDAMPLAAANALQIPMVLITSVENWPLTIITPEVRVSNVPIYLAFTQDGGDHYDSLIEISECTSFSSGRCLNSVRCRCGVNSKDSSELNCCEDTKSVLDRNESIPVAANV